MGTNKVQVIIPTFVADAKEGGILEPSLRNMDKSLANLSSDVTIEGILVVLNGSDEDGLKKLRDAIEVTRLRSRLNANLQITTSLPGQVNAIKAGLITSIEQGCDLVTITDIDVMRAPNSLSRLYKCLKDADQDRTTIFGANSFVYDPRTAGKIRSLSEEEILLLWIFEIEKNRLVSSAIKQVTGVASKSSKRLRSGLLLSPVGEAVGMYGGQEYVTDTATNLFRKTQKVEDAYFVHYGRTDLEDRVLARARHYQGSLAGGFYADFLGNQTYYSPSEAQKIADSIGDSRLSGIFLLSAALRNVEHQVLDAVYQKRKIPNLLSSGAFLSEKILPQNYQQAQLLITNLFIRHNIARKCWEHSTAIKSATPPQVTQVEWRKELVDIFTLMSEDSQTLQNVSEFTGIEIERLIDIAHG